MNEKMTRDLSVMVSIPMLRLPKRTEQFLDGKYHEPYLLTFSVDERGQAAGELGMNFMAFPKLAIGGTCRMLDEGYAIYGPGRPGAFVAFSLLVMQSAADVRRVPGQVEMMVRQKAGSLGLGAAMSASPGPGVMLGVIKELAQYVSGELQANGDDELFRIEGTLRRESQTPYHLNREYVIGNDLVDLTVRVLKAEAGSGEGGEVEGGGEGQRVRVIGLG
ncbi:MAG: hypothetical protein IT442_17390 [Phycisphaeraceae bacterium]|nr:hypothetical protein [Phycisphaeraceae bacterium]